MKRTITGLVLALVAVLLLPSLGFSERGIRIAENRTALVIGNGAYKNSPLKNPTNDAYDMSATLRRLEFEVTHLENANQRSMEDAIRQFGRQLRKGGVGLFYFAGHGVQVNGSNYLIPIGAGIEKETDVKYEAVDAGRVLDEMYEARNGLNVVILDACRDNPYARSFRTTTRGLARMDAPTGTFIAYATAPGSVAADGPGRNGIFTESLLEHMTIPDLKIEDVLKEVRKEVIGKTDHKQVPWQSSSLTGNFYFNPERAIALMKPPTAGPKRPKGHKDLEKERERLERERHELERLKIEVERKKLEEEKRRLEEDRQRIEAEEEHNRTEVARAEPQTGHCIVRLNLVGRMTGWGPGFGDKLFVDGELIPRKSTRLFGVGEKDHAETAYDKPVNPGRHTITVIYGKSPDWEATNKGTERISESFYVSAGQKVEIDIRVSIVKKFWGKERKAQVFVH